MFCFIYRRLLTHDKTIRIQPTGCYDTIKPRFWLRYHEAPVTDTSIASSCWANTRRGCHRAVPHSFLNGFEPYSIPLSQKRLLPCLKWETFRAPPFRMLNREGEIFVLPRNSYDDFELNGHIKCLNVRYDTCGVVTNSYVN